MEYAEKSSISCYCLLVFNGIDFRVISKGVPIASRKLLSSKISSFIAISSLNLRFKV